MHACDNHNETTKLESGAKTGLTTILYYHERHTEGQGAFHPPSALGLIGLFFDTILTRYIPAILLRGIPTQLNPVNIPGFQHMRPKGRTELGRVIECECELHLK